MAMPNNLRLKPTSRRLKKDLGLSIIVVLSCLFGACVRSPTGGGSSTDAGLHEDIRGPLQDVKGKQDSPRQDVQLSDAFATRDSIADASSQIDQGSPYDLLGDSHDLLTDRGLSDLLTTGCGTLVGVGSYATWSGKVNVHFYPVQGWLVDNDCMSGFENHTVAYCKKFYPRATQQVEIAPTPVLKPFTNIGCTGHFPSPGKRQFLCCAP